MKRSAAMYTTKTLHQKGYRAKKSKSTTSKQDIQKYLEAKMEKKNFDTLSTALIVAGQTTATVVQIFTPDQGTAPTERIGRRSTMKSLSYKFAASYTATTAGSSPIRMMIVYDRQPNAATPATTQIVTVDQITSPLNLINSRRFKIIVDECIEGLSAQGPQSFFVTGYRKLNNLETEFNDVNGGTIADITTGSMIMLVWQNGNIITASPTNACFIRIRFTDA